MTNSADTAARFSHADCVHPRTKTARALCRRSIRKHSADVAAQLIAVAESRNVREACACKGKPAGFHEANGEWVCVDCDRPTKGYLLNALGALLVA